MKTHNIYIVAAFLAAISTSAFGESNTDANSLLTQTEEDLLAQAKNVSWVVGNDTVLNSLVSTKENARELLDAVYGVNESVSSVADYRFIDLRGDGKLEMIAAEDISGRGLYNIITVLWKHNEEIVPEEIQTWDVEDLRPVMSDLNDDGTIELILPTVSDYQGATAPVTIIPKIYSIEGAGYTDTSKHFKDYYDKNVIPLLRQRLEIAKQAQNTGLVGVLQRELSEVLRLTNN